MVTATLPSLTDELNDVDDEDDDQKKTARLSRQSIAFSVESEMTITPERYTRHLSNASGGHAGAGPSKPSALAGYVGLATGCGALVALVLFLPLPTHFGDIQGVTPAAAVSYSFYVVGAVSLVVAVFVFAGLRNLKGEEGKGWNVLLGRTNGFEDSTETSHPEVARSKVS